MAILLEVGEVVAAPPAGKRIMRLNDSGAPVVVSPDGTEAAVATPSSGSVTNAQLADVATQTFKGRTAASTGVPTDLTATEATAMLNVATTSLKGLQSAADKSKEDNMPNLSVQIMTDANTNITLNGSAPARLIVPAGTLTQARTVKFPNAGAFATTFLEATVNVQGFNLVFTDSNDLVLYTVPAGEKTLVSIYQASLALLNTTQRLA